MRSFNDTLSRRAGVELRRTSEGALLVDMQSGRCFRLNRVAERLWSLAETARSLDEICDQLASEYRVDRETIARDARAMVADLVQHGLASLGPYSQP
jgi:hypothetical protein